VIAPSLHESILASRLKVSYRRESSLSQSKERAKSKAKNKVKIKIKAEIKVGTRRHL